MSLFLFLVLLERLFVWSFVSLFVWVLSFIFKFEMLLIGFFSVVGFGKEEVGKREEGMKEEGRKDDLLEMFVAVIGMNGISVYFGG